MVSFKLSSAPRCLMEDHDAAKTVRQEEERRASTRETLQDSTNKTLKNKLALWWFGWMHDVQSHEHNVAGVAVNGGFCLLPF